MMPASLRPQLLAAERRELERVSGQIRSLLAPEPTALRRYRRDHERSLPPTSRVVRRQAVVDAARRAEVVLVGDYHTLPEAQRAALGLAIELAQHRPLVLGLEMVRAEHQQALDAYLDGRLADGAFLEAIDYAGSWPFPWTHYRPLLDAARRAGWRGLALDTPGGPSTRDRGAARLLSTSLDRQPEALHLALVGDLHLAPSHLPRAVLATRRQTRLVIVHQNEPVIYERLVERRRDLDTTAVIMGPGRFCLLNATPLRRERSYLRWIEGRGDRGVGGDPVAELTAYHHRLADLLGVELEREPDLEVTTGHDLGFLDRLAASAVSPGRLAYVRRAIVERGAVLIGELGLAHLVEPATDTLAELAMLALVEELGEPPALDTEANHGRMIGDTLLAQVRREALAFLGSCLVHPLRAAPTGPVTRNGGRIGALSTELLTTLAGELDGERPLRVSARLTGAPAACRWGVTRRAGRVLGGGLFRALVGGRVRPGELVERIGSGSRGSEGLIELARLATRGRRARRALA